MAGYCHEIYNSYYLLMFMPSIKFQAFSRDQISSMFDHYKISSGQSQTTLLSVIHNISQKHPKQLAHFLPQLCDDSIFQPETMNFRSAIISSVGGLNEVFFLNILKHDFNGGLKDLVMLRRRPSNLLDMFSGLHQNLNSLLVMY